MAKKKTEALKVVTINVKEWLIPENVDDNFPSKLNYGGMKCCLGFWAKQIHGVPYTKMTDITMPSNLDGNVNCLVEAYTPVGPDKRAFEDLAADINDDTSLSLPMRKTKLTTLFKKVGVELKFEGELRPTKKPRPQPRPPR